jgi:hypothetical protein
MADKAHVLTDKEIEKMERHLSAIYSRAEKEVAAELEKYGKTVQNHVDLLLKNINSAKTEEERRKAQHEYRVFWLVLVKRDKRLKKAQETVADILYKANTEAAQYINSQTANIYALNYNQIGKGLSADLDGYDFKPVTVEDAEKYGKISKQEVSKKRDNDWNKKNVLAAFAAGTLVYYSASKMMVSSAKRITRKNRDGANRQASDMATDAENKGRLDSMYRASDEGFKVKKIWIATLDNRTRETHIEYDGVGPVDLDYEYYPGLKKPKDPNCDNLAEVCNCRCRLIYNTGHKRSATRAARSGEVTGSYKKPQSFKNTTTEKVKNMTYKEWMKWRSK